MHLGLFGPGLFFFPGLFGILGFIVSVLFWVFLIELILSFFKRSHSDEEEDTQKNKKTSDTDDSDLENWKTIRRRYAEGEITKREYEELKKEFK